MMANYEAAPELNDGKPLSRDAQLYLGLSPRRRPGTPNPYILSELVDSCMSRLIENDNSLGPMDVVSAGCASIERGYKACGLYKGYDAPFIWERNEFDFEPHINSASIFFRAACNLTAGRPPIERGGEFYLASWFQDTLRFRYPQSLEELQAAAAAHKSNLIDNLDTTNRGLHDVDQERPPYLFKRAHSAFFIAATLMQQNDIIALPSLVRQSFRLVNGYSEGQRNKHCWDISLWKTPSTNEQALGFFLGCAPRVRLRIEGKFSPEAVIAPSVVRVTFSELEVFNQYDQVSLAAALVNEQCRVPPPNPNKAGKLPATPALFVEPGELPAVSAHSIAPASSRFLDKFSERLRSHVAPYLDLV